MLRWDTFLKGLQVVLLPLFLCLSSSICMEIYLKTVIK